MTAPEISPRYAEGPEGLPPKPRPCTNCGQPVVYASLSWERPNRAMGTPPDHVEHFAPCYLVRTGRKKAVTA